MGPGRGSSLPIYADAHREGREEEQWGKDRDYNYMGCPGLHTIYIYIYIYPMLYLYTYIYI